MWVLYIFWRSNPCLRYHGKYFFPYSGSLFILLMFSLAVHKLFILMKSHLFILSFMSLALGDMLVEILLHGISEIFLPMFSSSKVLEVSWLIFKSFIHLEFICVCVWYKSVVEFHFLCSCFYFTILLEHTNSIFLLICFPGLCKLHYSRPRASLGHPHHSNSFTSRVISGLISNSQEIFCLRDWTWTHQLKWHFAISWFYANSVRVYLHVRNYLAELLDGSLIPWLYLCFFPTV